MTQASCCMSIAFDIDQALWIPGCAGISPGLIAAANRLAGAVGSDQRYDSTAAGHADGGGEEDLTAPLLSHAIEAVEEEPVVSSPVMAVSPGHRCQPIGVHYAHQDISSDLDLILGRVDANPYHKHVNSTARRPAQKPRCAKHTHCDTADYTGRP